MDARTFEFLFLGVVSVLSILGGYAARRFGWLHEDFSRKIHWFTIVVLWSLAALLLLWNLAPDPANLWVLAIEPLLVVIPAFLIIPLAKKIGLRRNQIGVLAMAAGLRNSGFALGSYLAYAILPAGALLRQQGVIDEAQAEMLSLNALAYGTLIVMTMSMAVVTFLFPIAQHFGDLGQTSLARLIFKSFVDWKAMLFYASAAGITLAYKEVPVPQQVFDWKIHKALIYLGAMTAYFGIGMRLHFDQIKPHIKSHIVVAGVKYVATPGLTIALLLIARNVGTIPPPELLNQTFLLMAFMPPAIQSVMISNLFHLDARMAGSIWIVNTLVFLCLVLPLILLVTPRLYRGAC